MRFQKHYKTIKAAGETKRLARKLNYLSRIDFVDKKTCTQNPNINFYSYSDTFRLGQDIPKKSDVGHQDGKMHLSFWAWRTHLWGFPGRRIDSYGDKGTLQNSPQEL